MMWEYTTRYIKKLSEVEVCEWLNDLGKDRWELVTVEGDHAYFKRPTVAGAWDEDKRFVEIKPYERSTPNIDTLAE
jgi:hypothetical protein